MALPAARCRESARDSRLLCRRRAPRGRHAHPAPGDERRGDRAVRWPSARGGWVPRVIRSPRRSARTRWAL